MTFKYFKKIHRKNFIKLYFYIRHHINLVLQYLLNDQVRQQRKDHKKIPIIIISFNQLYYLKQLVQFLMDNDYSNIVIIDNKSTYSPLLKYLESIENQIVIHRISANFGHLSFWKNNKIFKKYSKGYYVVTDADIVPLKNCPNNFLDTLRMLLDKYYLQTKVGLGLKIDDIPDTNAHKEKIVNWESKYWKSKVENRAFKAEIDTTFALYRPNYNYRLKNFTKAIRTDFPLQARHGGWYIDTENLTEEQQYYIQTANESASWLVNESGALINKKHKKLYSDE